VRIGNRAAQQRQLDVFGAVIDCMYIYQQKGGFISHKLWHVIESFADGIWQLSREPDNGIWEFQGERKHHTHSKLWCWVALDRAIRLGERLGETLGADTVHLDGAQASFSARIAEWKRAAAELRNEIESRSYSEKLRAFTQAYDDDCLDAAVLQMPVLGFLPATDPRMRSTIEVLGERLARGVHIRRYDCVDDQGTLSATFLLCSFWYIDCLIELGQLELAEERLREILRLRTPLGLLAEGADPATGAPRGNFPQAYSHLGLIDSALRLARAQRDAAAKKSA
jgi:GH15 family glucan-1,4-alpha-glucosidase